MPALGASGRLFTLTRSLEMREGMALAPLKGECGPRGVAGRPLPHRPHTPGPVVLLRLTPLGASPFDLAHQHVVKLRELGCPAGDHANNRFALGQIEVNMNRSRTERSFNLERNGGITSPAESRNQLGRVASVYAHPGHIDVAPQRHGEWVSPASTVETCATEAGRRRSRLCDPFASQPGDLAEEDAAELGEVGGRVFERGKDRCALRDGQGEDFGARFHSLTSRV